MLDVMKLTKKVVRELTCNYKNHDVEFVSIAV